MPIARRNRQTIWLAWLALLAGIWLVISPYIFGYSNNSLSLGNDLTIGILVVGLATVNIIWSRQTTLWLPWVIALVGLWELLSPFMLQGIATSAAVNDFILGLILIGLGIRRAMTRQVVKPEIRTGGVFYSRIEPSKRRRSKEG